MSWFKKKQEDSKKRESLPNLPPLPKLPELEGKEKFISDKTKETAKSISNTLPNLPGYTKEDIRGLNEEQFNPITTSPQPPSLPNTLPNTPRTMEISSGREEVIGSGPRTLELNSPITRTEKSVRTEPIFVRIDKYQSAVQAFHEIKKQLSEIEEYLKEIRQLKIKEEQELARWESQIETIKARLSNIDSGVFGKLS